ncbi:MAG: hypothetical protein A2341_28145 [Deltaproteobacteria bacterium RIFOXYB12_FULL_58_9]|nr:MAG: hypothetical protein A2341_28145 [Deltaproteobacteria bacterium RIFOXYB12_FULL_58_9]
MLLLSIIGGLVAAYAIARFIHTARLDSRLAQEIDRPLGSGADDVVTNAAIGAGAAVTTLEAWIELSQIEPGVLDAIDRVHAGGDPQTYAELVGRVEAASTNDASLAGLVSLYKGHYGEVLVAHELAANGHLIEFADAPNQAGWDLLVDGQQVQVKAGLDAGSITDHLERYPDVPVITVAEHADLAAGLENVTALEGVSGEAIQTATEETLDGVDGLADIGGAFPIFTALISGGKNIKLLAQSKTDIGTALRNTTVDTVGVGGGGFLGAKSGGILGAVIGGPIGAAVGGVLGGIGGAILGRWGAKRFREADLREAQEELERRIGIYAEQYIEALDAKSSSLAERSVRTRPGLLARLWPSYGTRTRSWIARHYRLWANRCRQNARDLRQQINAEKITKDTVSKVGRELLGEDKVHEPVFSASLQKTTNAIEKAGNRVLRERQKLGMA